LEGTERCLIWHFEQPIMIKLSLEADGGNDLSRKIEAAGCILRDD
jgi:hypothetical protein